MPPIIESLLPGVFATSAALYLGLAVYVSRSSPQSIIGFFLFLLGVMVAGPLPNFGQFKAHSSFDVSGFVPD